VFYATKAFLCRAMARLAYDEGLLLDVATAGELHVARHAVLAGTGSRPVRLGDVQAPGKRRMTAPEWARGLRSGGPVRFG